MESRITRKITAEEEELQRHQVELTALQGELAQRELDLATIKGELHAFEREYMGVVGIRYTELDRFKALIAQCIANLSTARGFKPSYGLKQLYREVAKQIHPDLATDDEDRKVRQELMAQVNRAYESADEERLQEILKQWESSPHSVQGDGIEAELMRALRRIGQSKQRLESIQKEIKDIEKTDLYKLQVQAIKSKEAGRDLLLEMAAQIDEQIVESKKRLEELKAKLDLRV